MSMPSARIAIEIVKPRRREQQTCRQPDQDGELAGSRPAEQRRRRDENDVRPQQQNLAIDNVEKLPLYVGVRAVTSRRGRLVKRVAGMGRVGMSGS
jgi:hypothetical protein